MLKNIPIQALLIIVIVFLSFENKPMISTKIHCNKTTFALGEKIEICLTLENNSKNEFRFCTWQSPFENRFTSDMFEITFENNKLGYRGMMIKRAAPKKEAYTTIEKTKSKTACIELSEAYSFDKKGIYTIKFKGSYINKLPDSNSIEITVE